MKNSRSLALAFLGAPLMSALLSVLLTPSATSMGLMGTLGMLGLFYVVSLIISMLFGVPMYCLFLYLRKINLITCLAGGILVGTVVGLILHFPSTALFRELAVMAAIGGASGVAFWIIWRTGPNNEALADKADS